MSGNRVWQTLLAPELSEKSHAHQTLEAVGDHEADEVELVNAAKVPKPKELSKPCVALVARLIVVVFPGSQ